MSTDDDSGISIDFSLSASLINTTRENRGDTTWPFFSSSSSSSRWDDIKVLVRSLFSWRVDENNNEWMNEWKRKTRNKFVFFFFFLIIKICKLNFNSICTWSTRLLFFSLCLCLLRTKTSKHFHHHLPLDRCHILVFFKPESNCRKTISCSRLDSLTWHVRYWYGRTNSIVSTRTVRKWLTSRCL